MDSNLNLNIIFSIPIDFKHQQLLLFVFYMVFCLGGDLRLVQEHVYIYMSRGFVTKNLGDQWSSI